MAGYLIVGQAINVTNPNLSFWGSVADLFASDFHVTPADLRELTRILKTVDCCGLAADGSVADLAADTGRTS